MANKISTSTTAILTLTTASSSTAGTYTGSLTITATGTVNVGANADAIIATTGPVTLDNAGVIIASTSGVHFINKPDTIINTGKIIGTAGGGVDLAGGGYLSNSSTGTISGASDDGVALGGTSINTIVNAGFIYGGTTGAEESGPGSLFNSGIIRGGTGSGEGVELADGGLVSNSRTGAITGTKYGIEMTGAAGTVVNAGTITGSTGILLGAGGNVTNAAGGVISGGTRGIALDGNANTLLNAGTITGGVTLSGTSNLLIEDTGAALTGGLSGAAGAANTLMLGAGAGYLGGIGTGFGTISFASGAAWTIGGTSAALASGALIDGFLTGNTINLTGFTATSEHFANNILTLSNSGGALELDITEPAGVSGTNWFTLTSDGNGGTDISSEVPCFCAGTRILGTDGEILVEDIGPGDELITVRDGGPATRKVIWTGRRTIDISRHPHPEMVRPVRIIAGAFGNNLPERDLRLSPMHAVYMNGCLFEAILLVNGITIFQEQSTRYVTYHHIELEAHDILLAEGLPTESFLDTGGRTMFKSVSGVVVLHPGFATPEGATVCAPMIHEGAELDHIRAGLTARRRKVG